ncbi:MAG: 3-oxoacyl-ACP reductase FabG [Candidatus Cloacimonetes bacterium]|jgi:NAD(P)-dependent dehydrogenase (short-subunit alcohol dehydrogenase family)|nr:3-oxoacyl-ACP reductase FabG [Candidatus Cloacimonadota bacterium]
MLKEAKTAFVTGGDKGIGRGIVQVLAEAGYKVIFSYKSNEKGAQELEVEYASVHAVQCDLADNASIQNALQTITAIASSIDVLVNNVGIDRDGVFVKMDFDTWSEVIQVNLVQIYHFIHSFAPGMIEKNWGRILNVSSIGAFQGSFGKSNYAASKAGILGLTKALALEFASKGITVNAICPGAFDTSMFERIPQKYREEIEAQIPMKRLGNPQEMGKLVKFLASDDAAYITGQTIHINGGWHLG